MLGCTNNNESSVQPLSTETKTVQPNPFSFYKDIELKPGYHFEVLSWGKGVDTIGGLQLLMSDSLKNNYKSMAAEREGIITDAWNLDLDNDGDPEIYVQTLVHKNVTDVQVYEFRDNGFSKISFPEISEMDGYEGNDKFFVKNGDLFRQVPLVAVDSAGKSVTVVKTFEYKLNGNSFSKSEVKAGE